MQINFRNNPRSVCPPYVAAPSSLPGPIGPAGPAGPIGPAGPVGTSSSFVFSQLMPAATWIIPHALGHLPVIAIYDSTGQQVGADVVSTTTSTTVTFAVPFSGSATLM